MLILSSISSSLEIWSVNHTSVYENSELIVLKNEKCLCKISTNWPNILGKNVYKTLEFCWELLLTTLQWANSNF